MKKNQKSVTYDADLSPWFYQLNGLQWSMMLTSVHDSINSVVYNDLQCWPQSMILSTPWFTMIYNADLGPWFYQLNGLQWSMMLTSVHDSINSMVDRTVLCRTCCWHSNHDCFNCSSCFSNLLTAIIHSSSAFWCSLKCNWITRVKAE